MKRIISFLILALFVNISNAQKMEVFFKNSLIDHLTFDQNGNFWASPYKTDLLFSTKEEFYGFGTKATPRHIAYYYNKENETWDTLNFKLKNIKNIYIDSNGNTWFIINTIVNTAGIYDYSSFDEVFLYKDKVLINMRENEEEIRVKNITEDDEGGLWFSTNKGLVCYKNDEWLSVFNSDSKINLQDINNLFIYDNKIWVGEHKAFPKPGGSYDYYIMPDIAKNEFIKTDYNVLTQDIVNWDVNGDLIIESYPTPLKLFFFNISPDGSQINKIELKTKFRVVPYARDPYFKTYYTSESKRPMRIVSNKGVLRSPIFEYQDVKSTNPDISIYVLTNFHAYIYNSQKGVIFNTYDDKVLTKEFIYDVCYNDSKYYFTTKSGIFEYDGIQTIPSFDFNYLEKKKIFTIIDFGSKNFIYDSKEGINYKRNDEVINIESNLNIRGNCSIFSSYKEYGNETKTIWLCTNAGIIRIID